MTNKKYPLWFLPNLWSLDAPVVAVAWMFMLACAWEQEHLRPSAYYVLGASVWCIYVLDRLIDVFLSKRSEVKIEERHHYHREHKFVFLAIFVTILVVAFYFLFFQLPGEIFLVGLPAAALSLSYFIVAVTRKNDESPTVKNSLAGFAFAFGVAAATSMYVPMGGVANLLGSSEVLFFAVLCILNINAIDVWEFSKSIQDSDRKTDAELSLTLPLILLAGGGILMAYWAEDSVRPFYYAIVFSSAALQIINRLRSRFSLMALRVLADLALILPLPLFFAV